MIKRILNLSELLEKKSHFLFGPRGTGKTTLIDKELGDSVQTITLLNSDFYLRLSARPAELEQIISACDKRIIVIDEVQKLPILLDEVHRLIEEKKIKFLLTGSSARKLKRGGANLLAGRAWNANLYPLTFQEITNFSLERYLNVGGLPAIHLSDYPQEELKAYVQNYLVEEVSAEGLVRNLPNFSRFVQKAAMSNGQILNFSEIASDIGVTPATVREYYRILEDTLLGFMIEPFRSKSSRKEISTSKFYLFDIGVCNSLRGIKDVQSGTDYFGFAFEQFIAQELRAAISYKRIDLPLQFWRTHAQQEVDFVIGDQIAIEVKSSQSSNLRMAKGLLKFAESFDVKHKLLVSRDQVERVEQEILFLPYTKFLEKLWEGFWFK